MSSLRDKLISKNKKINWEPSHIREGRFGEWLKEVKDWAVSRERYWGTPLPIWMSEDGSEKVVIDSIEDLKKHAKKSGNKYVLMRHGESEHNVKGIITSDNEKAHSLTEKGKSDVKKSALKLKSKKIDLIIHSPLLRTKQTAEIVNELLKTEIISDNRIREEDFGILSGKPWTEISKTFLNFNDRMYKKVDGIETLIEVKKRVGEFIYEIEKKYQNKNILIITHDGPASAMLCVSEGVADNCMVDVYKPGKDSVAVGKFIDFPFVPIPHDDEYRLDLHKPYIDEIELVSKNGKKLKRVKEVMDVWFDSGAMPFAEDHYPFENKNFIDKGGYPADFISEAIDQTRGWFYTLHAIGVLLGKGRAYKNVICLGHLNDKEGKKMSKSLGNIIDPWIMMDKYGADALRLWMYSVNQPGESKNFDEKVVDEIVKKNFNLLSNVLTFYELYRDKKLEANTSPKVSNALDKWILLKLGKLIESITKNMDEYRLLEPVREIRNFIEDLSTWYLQLSRDRFRDGDKMAKKTLYFVLKKVSEVLAPFAPFYAEFLFQNLKNNKDALSVHLQNWPTLKVSKDDKMLKNMELTRFIVSKGLEARSKENIKVRQPLGSLKIKEGKLDKAFIELIKDRVNVKEVSFDKNISEQVLLDTSITAELKEEGVAREFIRVLQDKRKEEGFQAKDVADLYLVSDQDFKSIFMKFEKDIKKTVGLKNIIFKESSDLNSIKIEDFNLKIKIVKN